MQRMLVLILIASGLCAETPKPLPPLREQAELQQQWLRLRLERHLPALMRKHGVAMWLVICREYNEDPAFFSLVSPTVFAARRRTIYVFFDRGEGQGVERLALGGGSNGGLYTVYRDPDAGNREIYGEGQWTLLKKLITERNPATIAIDISQTHAFSDGLSAGEREKLEATLGPDLLRRVVRAENLALEYQELRIPEMLPTYRQMMETVHWLIGRAFSNEVITPGKTTNQDVVWWLRQRVNDAGLGTWFQPSVRVQKPGKAGVSMLSEDDAVVIERGDVLHVDFGITALRLNTDTQHMGYVLREGEREPPAGNPAGAEEWQPATGFAAGTHASRQDRQPGAGGSARSHAVGGNQGLDLHAPDWRSRARRRSAHRFVGSPARRAGARRCVAAAGNVVLDRAGREHAGA